jgi:putative addiction module component (TIGR02574 family)
MSKRKKMLTAEEIETAALELPENEFESLVDRLIARREGSAATGNEWDGEWAAELERRIAEVDSGEVTPIPIEEAIAQWQSLLR